MIGGEPGVPSERALRTARSGCASPLRGCHVPKRVDANQWGAMYSGGRVLVIALAPPCVLCAYCVVA